MSRLPTEVALPNELERRQIFYTLKRWSSYTAWNRILSFYEAWADVFEKSLREASAKGWDQKTALRESDYVLVLKGLAQFDDGVNRLRKGDKRVFRCDANGTFAPYTDAGRVTGHWSKAFSYIETGDMAGGNTFTPYWDEFSAAFDDLRKAEGECFSSIVEGSYMGKSTHEAGPPYGIWFQENLPRMHFPDPLPAVPDPTDDVLVRTGSDLPCSGIWEPIEVPSRSIVSLFKNPPPKGPFPVAGCMNYLHGGTSAPKAVLETETANPVVPVAWRLLWRDDRYLDGTIPEEEKSYAFLEPEKSKPASPPVISFAITVQESGKRATASGRWLLQDDLFVAVTVIRGDVLPLHEGRSVRWVLART